MVRLCIGVSRESLLHQGIIHTGGKHALNKVFDITQHDPVTFRIIVALCTQGLDLYTLAYWHRKVLFQPVRVVEDGTGNI